MRSYKLLLTTVLFSSILAACGGGGDDTSSTPAPGSSDVTDKYVGTWVMCVPTGSTSSYKITLKGSKVSATSISYTYGETVHSNNTCSGTGTPDYTEAGTIAYKGTKTIGSDVVDKGEGTITFDNDSSTTEPRVEKDISLVSGNTIYTGDDSSGVDTDGYPNALFKTLGFTKQ